MKHLLLVVAVLSLAGCPKKSKPEAGPKQGPTVIDDFRIVEKTLPDGLVLQEVDTDNDDKPDVFNTFQPRTNAPRLLVRKEVDLDLDGKVDQISYYNDDGEMEREERDRDFDGHFDWTDHYQDNRRVMTEVDSDRDGKMDVFSYYEGEPPRITRKERDTNGDLKIDIWERFDDKGVVTRTGRDTDGDGKMDERDE